MLLYYITDRKQFGGTEQAQRRALLRRVSEAAAAGIDYIQLREKDLSIAELEDLSGEVARAVREHSSTTRLLINSRIDVALAAEADGVHLASNEISGSDARAIWARSTEGREVPRERFLIATSCHSIQDVRSAEAHGADFVVLAPIFEKTGMPMASLGLNALRIATTGQSPDMRVEAGDNRTGVPVLALGGVNLQNAIECIRAGAAGVAGIRMFQQGNAAETISTLRSIYTA